MSDLKWSDTNDGHFCRVCDEEARRHTGADICGDDLVADVTLCEDCLDRAKETLCPTCSPVWMIGEMMRAMDCWDYSPERDVIIRELAAISERVKALPEYGKHLAKMAKRNGGE